MEKGEGEKREREEGVESTVKRDGECGRWGADTADGDGEWYCLERAVPGQEQCSCSRPVVALQVTVRRACSRARTSRLRSPLDTAPQQRDVVLRLSLPPKPRWATAHSNTAFVRSGPSPLLRPDGLRLRHCKRTILCRLPERTRLPITRSTTAQRVTRYAGPQFPVTETGTHPAPGLLAHPHSLRPKPDSADTGDAPDLQSASIRSLSPRPVRLRRHGLGLPSSGEPARRRSGCGRDVLTHPLPHLPFAFVVHGPAEPVTFSDIPSSVRAFAPTVRLRTRRFSLLPRSLAHLRSLPSLTFVRAAPPPIALDMHRTSRSLSPRTIRLRRTRSRPLLRRDERAVRRFGCARDGLAPPAEASLTSVRSPPSLHVFTRAAPQLPYAVRFRRSRSGCDGTTSTPPSSGRACAPSVRLRSRRSHSLRTAPPARFRPGRSGCADTLSPPSFVGASFRVAGPAAPVTFSRLPPKPRSPTFAPLLTHIRSFGCATADHACPAQPLARFRRGQSGCADTVSPLPSSG